MTLTVLMVLKVMHFEVSHIKGFLGNRYACGRVQSGMLHCIPVTSSDMTAWLPQNLYRYLSSPLVSRLFDTQAKIGEKGESMRYFVM